MEEFFDYLLGLLLLVIIGITGALIYFSIHAPLIAYLLVGILVGLFTGVIGFFVRRSLRKKRLGSYASLLQSIAHSYKDIAGDFRRLDRHAKNGLKPLWPKIKKLRKTAKAYVWKVCDIDKTLETLGGQQSEPNILSQTPLSKDARTHEKAIEYHKRYYAQIHKIEASKTKYLQEIQEALQYFHSLHAQLLALRYSPNHSDMQNKLSETLDELLIDMEALDEVNLHVYNLKTRGSSTQKGS